MADENQTPTTPTVPAPDTDALLLFGPIANEIERLRQSVSAGTTQPNQAAAVLLRGVATLLQHGTVPPAPDEFIAAAMPQATEEFRTEVARLLMRMMAPPAATLAFVDGLLAPPEITLASGARISMADWIWESMRSAFVVDPQREDARWICFSYGPSQQLAGCSRAASRVHTNAPRNGDSGLPRDWEMLVRRWRAVADTPLITPVLNFAAETSVEFHYNDKRYATSTLLDLLMGTQHIADDDTRPRPDLMGLPVHMREGLMYEAVVECRSKPALDELREHLRRPIGVAADLERLERFAINLGHDATKALAAEIARVRARLSPPRALTCWVHLEGYMLRTIV